MVEKEQDAWIPKTRIGKLVKSGEIKSVDELLSLNVKVRDPRVFEHLLPNLETELIEIGQAKGKFGGGQRRVFKQTQKKSAEGTKLKFTCMAVSGNRDGYVGLGIGSSRETVPAREKAFKEAKINIIKIKRGCGSWECGCGEPHTVPFKVYGRCGSTRIELLPAPKGVGLAVHDEVKKILRLAGIKDVWSRTYGQTRSRVNLLKAVFNALKQLSTAKYPSEVEKMVGIKEGSVEELSPEILSEKEAKPEKKKEEPHEKAVKTKKEKKKEENPKK